MAQMAQFNLRQRLSGLKQQLKYVSNWSGVDVTRLNAFVLFLGNPRSGTTLVRSIVDAHPNAIIANELHTVRQMKAGASWDAIKRDICINSGDFKANPVWTDYSYGIPGIGKKGKVQIIGDKRSAGTVNEFSLHPHLINDLRTLIPIPIKVIRCIRNPYDVIATRTRRNELNADENLERYFFIENQAQHILDTLQPSGTFYVYSEELIKDPEAVIEKLISFLDLENIPDHVHACKSIVYAAPNLSRYNASFTPEQIARIEAETQKLKHLSYYLQDNRLPF